ncbi:MAG: hypothetical protein K2W95_35845 [Candidatus Obscuribacterales bacterium]|nr:hypothetical protein [Candidatus Obscuribacterales bacterium]
METIVVPLSRRIRSSAVLSGLVGIRTMSEVDFINKHASGTLRKGRANGMLYRAMYLHERSAHEFGYAFECIPSSRISTGPVQIEGDCHPLTELGWHAERMIARSVFSQDQFKVMYIIVDDSDGKRREGAGIVVAKTSAEWVPKNHVVFAIVTQCVNHVYQPAVNPC